MAAGCLLHSSGHLLPPAVVAAAAVAAVAADVRADFDNLNSFLDNKMAHYWF